jgi:hypothetical protein
MDATKPYKFIGLGAMDVTKTYTCIGCGAMDVTKPYKFMGFGAMDGLVFCIGQWGFRSKPDRFGPVSW